MDNDKNLYELGYLLVPIISPDKLGDEVNAVRSIIESNGGFIMTEEEPKSRKLMYEILHSVPGSKNVRYEDAYFGWMRFNLSSDAVAKLSNDLKKSTVLLRFLVINLTKDLGNTKKKDEQKKTQTAKRAKKSLSEKEIDKEIDILLAKDSDTKAV